jgi:multidrug efflux pump subunit AcrB
LLTLGVAPAGFFAFLRLPAAPLPQVDYPTITVAANLPGASPTTMATTMATPLEGHFGIVADVIGMRSESTVGITCITLQFSLKVSTAASTARRATCRRRSTQRAPTADEPPPEPLIIIEGQPGRRTGRGGR